MMINVTDVISLSESSRMGSKFGLKGLPDVTMLSTPFSYEIQDDEILIIYREGGLGALVISMLQTSNIEMVDYNVTKLNKKMRSMVRLKLSVVEQSMPEFYAKYCLKEVRIQKINTLQC